MVPAQIPLVFLRKPDASAERDILTVAHPQRNKFSDNLACGPKISCVSQSGVRGVSKHAQFHKRVVDAQVQWVTGQRSAVCGQ